MKDNLTNSNSIKYLRERNKNFAFKGINKRLFDFVKI